MLFSSRDLAPQRLPGESYKDYQVRRMVMDRRVGLYPRLGRTQYKLQRTQGWIA